MNKKSFMRWMSAIDDRYLEEAATVPVKKQKKILAPVLLSAACLALVTSGILFAHNLLASPSNNSSEDGITREYFTENNISYALLSCETAEPMDISDIPDASHTKPLVWYADGLELKLCSTTDMAWVSWYDTATSTQWCLTADNSTLSLLTTAKDILKELGYTVSVAPENATEVTYDAFLLNTLTVAETSFLLNGTPCRYRVASTPDISEDFADISGTGTTYSHCISTELGWCPAKLYYEENGYGKIIWFDIVPGLLYSLSMETNASEEALLSLARELFIPAQDKADW